MLCTVYLTLFTFRKAIDGKQRIVLPPGINKDDPLLVFLPTAGVHSENDQKGWCYCLAHSVVEALYCNWLLMTMKYYAF